MRVYAETTGGFRRHEAFVDSVGRVRAEVRGGVALALQKRQTAGEHPEVAERNVVAVVHLREVGELSTAWGLRLSVPETSSVRGHGRDSALVRPQPGLDENKLPLPFIFYVRL